MSLLAREKNNRNKKRSAVDYIKRSRINFLQTRGDALRYNRRARDGRGERCAHDDKCAPRGRGEAPCVFSVLRGARGAREPSRGNN